MLAYHQQTDKSDMLHQFGTRLQQKNFEQVPAIVAGQFGRMLGFLSLF
jgi:hypothetical protein